MIVVKRSWTTANPRGGSLRIKHTSFQVFKDDDVKGLQEYLDKYGDDYHITFIDPKSNEET